MGPSIKQDMELLYIGTGKRIEKGNVRDAIGEIFAFIRKSNKYFDTEQPWITRNSDAKKCGNTLYNCVQIIANLAVLLYPFLPFSSEKVCNWLDIKNEWKIQQVSAGFRLPEIEILFERLDKKIIDEEMEKLNGKECFSKTEVNVI